MRFPGVIPAVTTPFDAHGEVDLDALKGNARSLLDAGLTGLVGNGTMGEAGSLSAAERRTVLEALVDAADGRATVTAGVSAQNPQAAIAYARDAAAAGAGALMLLPPLLYGGDEREVLAYFAAVAAGHRPAADGLQQPRRQRRHRPAPRLPAAARPRRSTPSSRSRSAPATRGASPRWSAARLEVLVGGDDWPLEGFAAGATGWISGVANVAPVECVALLRHVQDGELDTAREINARMLPLARLDMTPKLVQYFKAAQDAVGRVGGPCRPPRLELTEPERALLDAALGALHGQEVAA